MQQFGEVADLGAAAPQRRGKLRRAPAARARPREWRRRAAWRYFAGLSAAVPYPDDAAGLCRAGRPRCPRRGCGSRSPPDSSALPPNCHITVSITTLTFRYATDVAASAVDRRHLEQRPDGGAAVICSSYPPAPGQMGHDGQAAAAERRKRRPRRTRPGHGAAVTDRDLQHAAVESPSRRARDRPAADAHAGARCSAVRS